MRLVSLGLVRFGPFSDTRIELGEGPGGLHLVHGPNEAGKSTALRAVSGLLYGIAHDTVDAHMHPMPELRLSGRLVARDGTTLSFERRKGRKNTLLAPDGSPADEATLERMLGGVAEEQFETAFGLDQHRLRAGAEALLADDGDVGQSLFDAALGGRGIKRLLDDLKAEAEALYSPRANASTRAINARLRAFKEAERRAKENSTPAQAMSAQKKGLDAAERLRGEIELAQRALAAERERLERALRAGPKLARLAEIGARLGELGDLPELDADASEQRVAAEHDLEARAREIVREEAELARIESALAELGPAEAISELDDERMRALFGRLANEDKASSDKKKLQGELRVVEGDLAAALASLGVEGAELAERGEISVRQQARIDADAGAYAELAASVALAEARVAEAALELAGLEATARALPDAVDFAELSRALAAARRVGDVDARLAEAERRAEELSRAVARAKGSLRPFVASAALAVPARESVDVFDERFRAHERDEARLAERAGDAARALGLTARDLDALRREGDVPTEADLILVRGERDRALAELKQAGSFAGEPAERFEGALRASDEVADRLRREAGRVAKLAQLEAERARLEAELARTEAERGALELARQATEADWRAAWAPAGFVPATPAEMRGWLGRHAALVELERQLDGVTAEREALARALDENRGAMRRAFAALGSEVGAAAMLAELVAQAEERLARLAELERERAELARDVNGARERFGAAERGLEERRRALAAWRERWAVAVAPLGLDADARPEEARAVLEARRALAERRKDVEGYRRRIAGIERDSRELAEEVAALCLRYAPDLSERPFAQAGRELVARHAVERKKRSERDGLVRRRGDARARLAEAKERQVSAEATLGAMLSRARVERREELPALERRVAEARRLEAERLGLEADLAQIRGTLSLDALAEEARELEPSAARVRIAEIDAEQSERGAERDRVLQDIAGIKLQFERFADSSAAAEAEAEAMSHAARLREDVERYVRVRLAAWVLAREVERYREENQGPLLSRASEIFASLTEARYVGLSAGFGDDDEPVLACRRADGASLGVAALSEGTRDQLYLALRLASFERFCRANEPLPLVLDDVLVQFDEARSRAALGVLGELAAENQILMFTHHAHVVELARETVPAGRLVVHPLARRELVRPGLSPP